MTLSLKSSCICCKPRQRATGSRPTGYLLKRPNLLQPLSIHEAKWGFPWLPWNCILPVCLGPVGRFIVETHAAPNEHRELPEKKKRSDPWVSPGFIHVFILVSGHNKNLKKEITKHWLQRRDHCYHWSNSRHNYKLTFTHNCAEVKSVKQNRFYMYCCSKVVIHYLIVQSTSHTCSIL